MKMKSGCIWAGALVLAALGASFCARAQKAEASVTGTIASDTGSDEAKGRRALLLTVGDGGTGAYKAVLTGEESLKTHTIFRPRDLSQFWRVESAADCGLGQRLLRQQRHGVSQSAERDCLARVSDCGHWPHRRRSI